MVAVLAAVRVVAASQIVHARVAQVAVRAKKIKPAPVLVIAKAAAHLLTAPVKIHVLPKAVPSALVRHALMTHLVNR